MQLRRLRHEWQAGRLNKPDYIARMHAGHAILFEYPELLSNCSIDRIEISRAGVQFISEKGLRFACAPNDQRAAPIEAINFGSYEAADERLFFSLLRPGQTIIDVGAHIGWYSIHAAAQDSTNTLVAIEPAPDSARWLRHNVALNHLNNVEVIEVACAETNGTTSLYVPTNWPTASSTADILATGKSITVATRTLDDLVSARNLRVDLIKIDVEGGEWSVLRGSASILRDHRPTVFCEMLRKWSAQHGRHPNELLAWMAGLGYRCGYLSDNGLTPLAAMTDDIVATNFVFQHESTV